MSAVDGDLREVDRLALIAEKVRTEHDTATAIVLNAVRQAILEGVLVPGQRLRQEDLGASFGTSRVPVRDALRLLEYEGYVTSEPRRGFVVAGLSAADIEEIYALRTLLESYAVRMAIPLLTSHDIDELDALFHSIGAADDPEEQLRRRETFYARLYSVTAMPRLLAWIMRLRQEAHGSPRLRLAHHSPDHRAAFWEAIRNGDSERAVAELEAHRARAVGLLRRFLREAEIAKVPGRSLGR
jgi:DNA-binding GntR family transcriptional regulator